jgi:hypothetical protein
LPANVRQFALQGGAVSAVLCLAWLAHALGIPEPSWGTLALAVGLAAGLLAWWTGQPAWWRAIHGAFMPLVWAVNAFDIDPNWFLAVFVLMLLTYRGAIAGRVPLYLSNARTAARLAAVADDSHARSLVDLGAGVGSIVVRLARSRPDLSIAGVENAPLTWLVGWAITRWRGPGLVDWRYGSLWDVDLGDYALVYAFLSPEPMPALWVKAQAEMTPGSLLVSNSFPVPDQEPTSIVDVNDRRQTRLYCYVIDGPQPLANPPTAS